MDKLQSFKYNVLNSLRDINEYTVDTFEEFIEKFKSINLFLRNVLAPKWKTIILDVEKKRDYILCELKRKKETICDDFEDFINSINNVNRKTSINIESIGYKFDDLIIYCNEYSNDIMKAINISFYEKKDDIIDNFDCIISNLSVGIDQSKATITERMAKIKDKCKGFIKDIKFDVDEKNYFIANDFVCTLKAALCEGEYALHDFLNFSEIKLNEFLQFSEKELAYSLNRGKKKLKVFYNEVVDSLVRGYEDKLLCDNLVLEINSSRYAYNVTMSEVNFHVVRALLTLPAPDGQSWQQLAARLKYFMPIFTNYIRTVTAQKDCLFAIEDVAGTHPEVFNIIVKIIHWLYEQDILSEDIILNWYNNPIPDNDISTAKRVRNQVTPFIKWLKEAEEQSDEEDD